MAHRKNKQKIADIFRSMLKHDQIPAEVVAIYIYGSAVIGRLREDSDIDVGLLASHRIDEFKRLEVISKIEALFSDIAKTVAIDLDVSILDLRAKYAALQLQYVVITSGELLFERDVSERMDFENMIKGEFFDFEPFVQSLRKIKYGDVLQEA